MTYSSTSTTVVQYSIGIKNIIIIHAILLRGDPEMVHKLVLFRHHNKKINRRSAISPLRDNNNLFAPRHTNNYNQYQCQSINQSINVNKEYCSQALHCVLYRICFRRERQRNAARIEMNSTSIDLI
jgi:hypothetical protein